MPYSLLFRESGLLSWGNFWPYGYIIYLGSSPAIKRFSSDLISLIIPHLYILYTALMIIKNDTAKDNSEEASRHAKPQGIEYLFF